MRAVRVCGQARLHRGCLLTETAKGMMICDVLLLLMWMRVQQRARLVRQGEQPWLHAAAAAALLHHPSRQRQ